jgi:hypothetical protein
MPRKQAADAEGPAMRDRAKFPNWSWRIVGSAFRGEMLWG